VEIQFKDYNKTIDHKSVKKLLLEAFPVHERYPLFYLIWKSKSKNIKFYSMYDGELWIGFNYLIFYKDLIFIQYIAIDSNVRSKGYGGKVIEKIKEIYPEYRIALGIEQLNKEAKNNELRIRRKKFYLKNGFIDSCYYIKQKPVPFEILFYGKYFEIEEVLESVKIMIGKTIWKILYPFFKKSIKQNCINDKQNY